MYNTYSDYNNRRNNIKHNHMNLLPPENIIKQELHSDEPIQRVKDRYNFACGVMEKYKTHILDEYDKDFNKVIAKVNFLMRACLRKDNDAIDQFLTDFGKVYTGTYDEFGIDFNKIIQND